MLRLLSKYKRIIAHRFAMCHLFVTRGLLTCFGCGKGRAARQCATSHLRVGLPRGALGLRPSAGRGNSVGLSSGMTHNVSICVRAGLPKPRLVPDNERIKDTKTLDYASTPLDANTLLWAVSLSPISLSTVSSRLILFKFRFPKCLQ